MSPASKYKLVGLGLGAPPVERAACPVEINPNWSAVAKSKNQDFT